jgi:hypothetical protein
MSTTESPYSFTTKLAGDLLTVRGDNVDQFADRLAELAADPRILDALSELQSLGGNAPAVAAVKQAMPGSQVVSHGTPISSGPQQETDKYGAVFTYEHPDAPDLPDGRGKYILKNWRDKSGKSRTAFVDPVKGPRPFTAGAAEAPIQWV